jgi:hypothetical protein
MPLFHSSGNYFCPRIVVCEVEIDPLDNALPSWRHDSEVKAVKRSEKTGELEWILMENPIKSTITLVPNRA